MVMCLGEGADLHMTQLMPLPLIISCSSKSRLVLPSWFYLSGAGSPVRRVVPDKIQEGRKMVVCMRVCVCVCVWYITLADWQPGWLFPGSSDNGLMACSFLSPSDAVTDTASS